MGPQVDGVLAASLRVTMWAAPRTATWVFPGHHLTVKGTVPASLLQVGKLGTQKLNDGPEVTKFLGARGPYSPC